METLFRLALTRPPVAQDEKAPSILLRQDSQFQAELAQAQQGERLREALEAVARRFIASANFVGDAKSLPIHDQLKALAAGLDKLEKKGPLTRDGKGTPTCQ